MANRKGVRSKVVMDGKWTRDEVRNGEFETENGECRRRTRKKDDPGVYRKKLGSPEGRFVQWPTLAAWNWPQR